MEIDALRSPAPGEEAAGNARGMSRFEQRRRRNREALLRAAILLFQKQGMRATRIEEVCARAHVSPRTFFNHFATREHLTQAIAQRRATELAARLDALRDDARPLDARLRDLFAQLGAYLAARPRYRELVGEMLRLRIDGGSEVARSRTLGRAAQRFLEAAALRGELSQRHAPAVLADLWIGALTVALTNWCADPAYDLERELARTADALLDLLAAAPAHPARPPR